MITGNEPAMPHPKHEGKSGLSIREEFAARAMQGIVSGNYSNLDFQKYMKEYANESKITFSTLIAKLSIEYADSLIAQLNATEGATNV